MSLTQGGPQNRRPPKILPRGEAAPSSGPTEPANLPEVELELRGEDQRFSALTETVPAIIFIHHNGRFTYVNSAAEQILGYPKAELLTLNFWDVVHPDCRQMVRERGLSRQQGVDVPARYRLRAVTKAGKELWLECSASQVPYGADHAVLGCAFDITERAHAEERLAIQYRVAQILGETGALQDAASRLLSAVGEGLGWSFGALWTLDLSANQLICRAIWHPHDTGLAEFSAGCLKNGFPSGTGLPGRVWAELRAVWIPELSLEPLLPRASAASQAGLRSAAAFPITLEGRLLGVIEFFSRDVRAIDSELLKLMAAIGPQLGQFLERKKTEEALRESENRFALFMRHLPGAAWMKDISGRYLYANETAEKIFRICKSELCGRCDDEVFPPETAEQFKRNDQSAIQGGRGVQVVEAMRQPDGVHHSIVSKFPILNESGDPVMVGGVAIDITERIKAEQLSAAFAQLGQRLSVATTRLEAARIIVDIAQEILGWDACYLHLAAPKHDQLIPVLTIDTVEGRRIDIPPSTFTMDPSPMMLRVMNDGAQQIDRDADVATPALVAFGNTTRRSAAMMYVPIRSGAKMIGILSIQSYTPHAYQSEDLGTLQTLADHGGGALQRIQMAEALHELEARNQVLLNSIPDWMFRIRRDGTLLDCKIPNDNEASPYFRRFVGHKITKALTARIGQDVIANIEKTLEEGGPRTFEFQHALRDAVHDYEARIMAAAPDEVLVIVRDFSDQARLEREVLAASEQERQRIGKDLHDGLGQHLAGLGYLAKALEEKLSAKRLQEHEDAARISRLMVQALTQTRDLARGLFPVELETKGLLAALKDLAEGTKNLYGISCSLEYDADSAAPERTVQEHLYRLTQEAINNAVRHGKARSVAVTIRLQRPGRMLLTVRDNGAGFTLTPGTASGMGLRNMQCRARAIGGELEVRSPSQGGTIVTCSFPI
jgi:PAS domain S-box-containing protein